MALDAPERLRPSPRPGLVEGPRPPGRFTDSCFRWLALGAGLTVFAVLALIAFSTTKEAWPWFQKEGLSAITSRDWIPSQGRFGALSLIYGTLLISFLALLIAVPVSIGIALCMTEVAPRWLRRPVVYVVDLLAVIPSVVYGLWGVLLLAQPIGDFYQKVSDAVASIPVLNAIFSGDPVSGRSFMTAGIILAIMITPIITSLTREVFATTPTAQKEAALALGATRWEMIRGSVFPHSHAGVLAAVMIGLGRAMGETIAVALVIGSSQRITAKLFSTGDAMPSIIANQFNEATGTHRAALIGLGVVLFVITIILGAVARALLAANDRRLVHG